MPTNILPTELNNFKLDRDHDGVVSTNVIVYRPFINGRGDFIEIQEDGTQVYGTYDRGFKGMRSARVTSIMTREMPSFEASIKDLIQWAPGKSKAIFKKVWEEIQENTRWQDDENFAQNLFRKFTQAIHI